MALKSLQLKRIILFAVIGLVVFIFYLNYYVGTGNFVDVIRQANIYFYTSAFVAFIVATFFSALTWHSLLGNLKVQTSIRRTVILTWAGYFFDATLPEPGWSRHRKRICLAKSLMGMWARPWLQVVSQKIIGMAVTVFLLILGFAFLQLTMFYRSR